MVRCAWGVVVAWELRGVPLPCVCPPVSSVALGQCWQSCVMRWPEAPFFACLCRCHLVFTWTFTVLLLAFVPYSSVTSTANPHVHAPDNPARLNTAPLGPVVSVRVFVPTPSAWLKSTWVQGYAWESGGGRWCNRASRLGGGSEACARSCDCSPAWHHLGRACRAAESQWIAW